MPRTNLSDAFTTGERHAFKPKIVARNTFRFTLGDEIVYRLHGTDVVRQLPDGSAILNSGGWRTVTTKARMNDYLPAEYHLYSDKGQWWISAGAPWGAARRVPYYDGIQVPQCFDDAKAQAQGERTAATEAKLRKQIKAFVAKLDKLTTLPEPSPSDCWFCSMRDKSGTSWGAHSAKDGDPEDHIREHVVENYLHGSLIYNAIAWAGYRHPEVIWQLGNQQLARGHKPTMVKRALKRYLYRKLGLVS